MQIGHVSLIPVFLVALLAGCANDHDQRLTRESAMNPSVPAQTGYAAVHGFRIYYEIYGVANAARPPLVLLGVRNHGSVALWTSGQARAAAAFED